MLAGLISVLMLAVAQFAFVLHVRNTATAHVIEGARLGARADSTPEAGAARAQALLEQSLPSTDGISLTSSRVTVDGFAVVQVSADLTLPVLGPFGPGGALTVTGQAFAEDQ